MCKPKKPQESNNTKIQAIYTLCYMIHVSAVNISYHNNIPENYIFISSAGHFHLFYLISSNSLPYSYKTWFWSLSISYHPPSLYNAACINYNYYCLYIFFIAYIYEYRQTPSWPKMLRFSFILMEQK